MLVARDASGGCPVFPSPSKASEAGRKTSILTGNLPVIQLNTVADGLGRRAGVSRSGVQHRLLLRHPSHHTLALTLKRTRTLWKCTRSVS
jgi:hypothetical protein